MVIKLEITADDILNIHMDLLTRDLNSSRFLSNLLYTARETAENEASELEGIQCMLEEVIEDSDPKNDPELFEEDVK